MLNGDDLAKKIFNAINGADPNDKSSNIAIKYQKAIGDYIQENLEVKASFSGNNVETGAPLVLPVDGSITFPAFIFLPAADNIMFHLNLATAVKSGIITFSEPTNMLAATPTAFMPTGFFANIFPNTFDASENDVMKYMKAYCENIVRQLKSNFQTPPVPATYSSGTFVGTIIFTMNM